MSSEVVVITGAASGIGRSLAQKYLESGAKVAALDFDSAGLAQLETDCAAHREHLKTYTVDVSKEDEVILLGSRIAQEFARPTIWINNAGIAILGPFERITSKDFDRVLSVNFKGVVYGTRAAISVMKEPVSGKIVNIASVSGVVPAPFMSPYVAAKHAVVGFTRALQEEMDQTFSPLKIILVSPGFVKTKIMTPQSGMEFPEWLQWMIEEPEAVAEEVIRGVARGKKEINPTAHGRFLMKMHRFAPDLVVKSSRLLVAKSWKELLGISPIRK